MNKTHQETAPSKFSLFELGFRPFFSAAGLFAVFAIALWMLIYVFGLNLSLSGLAPDIWHAHEMIFGYAMAVVAGFLLTAVGNWTGISSLKHSSLVAIIALWLTARVGYLLPFELALEMSALTDILFNLFLIVGVSRPILQVKQWRQLGIVSVLCLLLAANGVFYAGAMGFINDGIRFGLYSGLYLIMALILVLARRVMPAFISRGVEEDFTPRNQLWIDVVSMVLLVVWMALSIFTRQTEWIAWTSMILCLLHAWRLHNWYSPGIWKKPLLWSLFLGYVFFILGFAMTALSIWVGISPFLAIHAFAVGGVGMVTLGMMSRVSLGHTGRNVFDPPKILRPTFILMVSAALVRTWLPLVEFEHYVIWVAFSQILWIAAFASFSLVYIPVLIRPRVDGRPG